MTRTSLTLMTLAAALTACAPAATTCPEAQSWRFETSDAECPVFFETLRLSCQEEGHFVLATTGTLQTTSVPHDCTFLDDGSFDCQSNSLSFQGRFDADGTRAEGTYAYTDGEACAAEGQFVMNATD